MLFRRRRDGSGAGIQERGNREPRPVRRLRLTVASALILGIAGIGSTYWIRSPEQELAEAAPPAPTVLTSHVERRVLKQTVVVRGQVSAGRTLEVTPGTVEGRKAVLTGLRIKEGDTFSSGSVLLEVAGRPVIVLRGAIPAYRDLRPGSEGKDVKQLQKALRVEGFAVKDRVGYFGSGTKTALSKFYRAIGYTAMASDETSETDLTTMTDAVRRAEREYRGALKSLKDAKRSDASASEIEDRLNAVRDADEDLRMLKQRRAEAESRYGAMLPMSEVIFLPSFPGRVEKLGAVAGAEIKPPLLTVSWGELVVTAKVSPAQTLVIKKNMRVQAISDADGKTFVGKVSAITDIRQDETGVRAHSVRISPVGRAIPESLAGANLRVTVEAASTNSPVLVVPVSAVYTGVDGQAAVRRQSPGGRTEQVPVTVGISGDGYVSVEPTQDSLREGDSVVVGGG
jgi:HlyD family secretion protein